MSGAAGEQAKPLHVRVAEALGWSDLTDTRGHILLPGEPNMRLGSPPPGDLNPYQYIGSIDLKERILTVNSGSVPRYDTDWSATGPLIEQFGIRLQPHQGMDAHGDGGWNASRGSWADFRVGPTPLVAVCNLVLALHAAGKLAGQQEGR